MDSDGTWIDEDPYPGPASSYLFDELDEAWRRFERYYNIAGRAFGRAFLSQQFLSQLRGQYNPPWTPPKGYDAGLDTGPYQKQYINQVDHSTVPHLRYKDRSSNMRHRAWKSSRR